MGLRSTWRRTPLWLRLVSTMLALAALGLTLTAAFGVRLLRGYLVERVDEQLEAAVRQFPGDLELLEPQRSDVPSPFHVSIVDAEGAVRLTAQSSMAESQPDIPLLTPEEAAARNGEPFSVDARRGDGSWRTVALPATDGSGTLFLAISLDEVDATVRRLVQIDLLVGLAVLGGLALVGISMVRTALRPLAEIELTAAAIGRGDLARRVPDHHPETEMGRLSRALNVMLEQIERGFRAQAASESQSRRSEERMRRFVADASHELRTPLTSIRGFAELHRQGAVTDPAEVSTLLARIEGEARRMGLLVDDLLLLARLDQQRPLQQVPVDLVAVATAAVEAARAGAAGREIELTVAADAVTTAEDTVEVADPLPDAASGRGADATFVVPGDEARLHQVLANLLDNALAYSPPDAPVSVRLGPTVRDGHRLASIEVIDRGAGLSPDQAERVFERFYRTDAARNRARGGSGLGLSIVAAITRAHGGVVELDSEVGQGSTFRVLLPAEGGAPPPQPTSTPTG